MELRDLKAIERRKRIRKYIRLHLSEVEMAEKEEVNVSTISGDVSIIKQENAGAMFSSRKLIEKNIVAQLATLHTLNEIDIEAWKIYYSTYRINDVDTGPRDVEISAQTKLLALEKIRQNNIERAKLLKLLNPTQVNIEKLVYVEKMMPVMINRVVEMVIEYVPEDKRVELLQKLQTIDIEGEIRNE